MLVMPTLPQLIPDVDALLGLAPEEAAQAVLTSATSMAQNGMFTAIGVVGPEALFGRGEPGGAVYPRDRAREVEEALGVAWLWLEINLFLIPVPGINGQNGWRQLTRRGREAVADPAAFRSFQVAAVGGIRSCSQATSLGLIRSWSTRASSANSQASMNRRYWPHCLMCRRGWSGGLTA